MNDQSFETRKRDHLGQSLNPKNQASGWSGLERIRLRHEALPEMNFTDVQTKTHSLGLDLNVPFFVSSMTAGHSEAIALNARLARLSAKHGWIMGVGSQRRQLFDTEARQEWQFVRTVAPDAVFLANLGLAQAIQTPTKKIKELIDSLDAIALIIHLNSLQEVLQPEGTPQFAGGLKAIERIVREVGCPVIVKETGCGMSFSTLQRLANAGVRVVDVSGLGGTHWGRIEGQRSSDGTLLRQASETYADWGISTVDSVIQAQRLVGPEVWASGGIRTGLDAAKMIAMGARLVGFAQPVLEAAQKGEEALDQYMERMEYELRIALFCTGSRTLSELRTKWEVQ